jgi:hypothetical protein
MHHASLLRIAYAANIAILAPVCWAMRSNITAKTVFEDVVEQSDGLRLLVFSVWLSILGASILGLLRPEPLRVILLVQVAYKALWLVTFVLPRLRAGTPIPAGIAVTFLVIVIAYPLIYLASR